LETKIIEKIVFAASKKRNERILMFPIESPPSETQKGKETPFFTSHVY